MLEKNLYIYIYKHVALVLASISWFKKYSQDTLSSILKQQEKEKKALPKLRLKFNQILKVNKEVKITNKQISKNRSI